jgi:magnesium chelatase family protein
VEVTPVPFSELSSQKKGEGSESIRDRVIAAREIQAERYKEYPGIYCNAQINSKMLKEICVIDTVGQNLLKAAMDKLNLSARAYDRILKVSKTIADLAKSENIKPEHLAEAIQYRSLDRDGWAGCDVVGPAPRSLAKGEWESGVRSQSLRDSKKTTVVCKGSPNLESLKPP